MFIPPHFAETDREKLHEFIERDSFGVLVSPVEGVPFATHLPFLLERGAGPHGTLVGHMARANPQWQALGEQSALVVFSGPHAYISPSWYEAENVVPTWNYVAVHAVGKVHLIHEPDALLKIVQRSIGVYETGMPRPWSLDETGPIVAPLLKQIVGFRLEIETLEGKWKLNQNHPVERRAKVAQALRELGGENGMGIADLMT